MPVAILPAITKNIIFPRRCFRNRMIRESGGLGIFLGINWVFYTKNKIIGRLQFLRLE